MNKRNQQKDLQSSNTQREIDLIYLSAIQLCQTKGWFHLLKRWESVYKLHQLRKEFKYPRLDGQGEYESICFIGTNPSVRSKLKDLWTDPYGEYFGGFLKEAGIDPKKIYVTNIYKYPTDKNRPLTPKEIESGKEELMLEIIAANPNVIVTLGAQANSVFKDDEIYGISIVRASHPSYVKRVPEIKVEFIKRLKLAKQINDKTRIRKRSLISRNVRGRDHSTPNERG